MIAEYNITSQEEIDLLQNISISISKKLKQNITFTKDEHSIRFNNDLEPTLKQNVKNLVPENVYNFIIMNASMQNEILCKIILNSSGYEIINKFANSIFKRNSFAMVKMTHVIDYQQRELKNEYKKIIKI